MFTVTYRTRDGHTGIAGRHDTYPAARIQALAVRRVFPAATLCIYPPSATVREPCPTFTEKWAPLPSNRPGLPGPMKG